MSKKEKQCKCKGQDENCPICEGTGIVLFDEKMDDALEIMGDKKFDSDLEEDE